MSISLSTTVTFCGGFHETFACISGLDEKPKPSKALMRRIQTSKKNSVWICYFLKANKNLQTCKPQVDNDFYIKNIFVPPASVKKEETIKYLMDLISDRKLFRQRPQLNFRLPHPR